MSGEVGMKGMMSAIIFFSCLCFRGQIRLGDTP